MLRTILGERKVSRCLRHLPGWLLFLLLYSNVVLVVWVRRWSLRFFTRRGWNKLGSASVCEKTSIVFRHREFWAMLKVGCWWNIRFQIRTWTLSVSAEIVTFHTWPDNWVVCIEIVEETVFGFEVLHCTSVANWVDGMVFVDRPWIILLRNIGKVMSFAISQSGLPVIEVSHIIDTSQSGNYRRVLAWKASKKVGLARWFVFEPHFLGGLPLQCRVVSVWIRRIIVGRRTWATLKVNCHVWMPAGFCFFPHRVLRRVDLAWHRNILRTRENR